MATLIDTIDYLDGYIENCNSVDGELGSIAIEDDDYEVIEDNLRGWGSATAVIFYEGQHFLARVS